MELFELSENNGGIGEGARLVDLLPADRAFFVDDEHRTPSNAGILVVNAVAPEGVLGMKVGEQGMGNTAQASGEGPE